MSTRREVNERKGAYGVIKHAEILSTLPPEEQEEYRRLELRRPTIAIRNRMRFLDLKASELYGRRQQEPQTADNNLEIYAAELATRLNHPSVPEAGS